MTTVQDRLVTNLQHEQLGVLASQSSLAGMSGCPVVGYGNRYPIKSWVMSAQHAHEVELQVSGFRKTAFWHTLDPLLLGSLKVRYVYFFAEESSPSVLSALRRDPRFIPILEDWVDTQFGRVLFRIDVPPSRLPDVSEKVDLISIHPPGEITERGFAWIPIRLRARQSVEGELPLFHWIVYQDPKDPSNLLYLNYNDEIECKLQLKANAGEEIDLRFPFVAPLDRVLVRIELFAGSPKGRRVRLGEGGPIRVTE
jgi:hypothetical protein